MHNRDLPALYKSDSKGKIREWQVQVYDHNIYAEIDVVHGELDGKKQSKTTLIHVGKNIGKTNETSYLEQAFLEAKSKLSKQLDKGYAFRLDAKKSFLPMLAHEFKKHEKKVKYPCYVQPKLDGLRCTIALESDNVIARSRKGKTWNTIDHILDSVEKFLVANPSYILDGEIYCDSSKLSFQEICSAIKRDEPNDRSKLAEFWCYDLYDTNQPDLTFTERTKLIPSNLPSFVKVETTECSDLTSVHAQHAINVSLGYEGSIVRTANGKYKVDGRSHDLLKLKDFQDAEYLITNKYEDKNNECVFVCLDQATGKTFSCKPEGDHNLRVSYLHDDNIGQFLTVRFFELTDEGLPRFPVGVCIRFDLD